MLWFSIRSEWLSQAYWMMLTSPKPWMSAKVSAISNFRSQIFKQMSNLAPISQARTLSTTRSSSRRAVWPANPLMRSRRPSTSSIRTRVASLRRMSWSKLQTMHTWAEKGGKEPKCSLVRNCLDVWQPAKINNRFCNLMKVLKYGKL